jgi:hypothetical protein
LVAMDWLANMQVWQEPPSEKLRGQHGLRG